MFKLKATLIQEAPKIRVGLVFRDTRDNSIITLEVVYEFFSGKAVSFRDTNGNYWDSSFIERELRPDGCLNFLRHMDLE